MVLDLAWVDPQPKGSGKKLLSIDVLGLCVQGGSQGEEGTSMGPKGVFRNQSSEHPNILPFTNGYPEQ